MQAGRVVRIRVGPKDCLRVVDALARLGIDPVVFGGRLSFSQATKMVLESCLLALERDKIIPTRDGFEYLEMMAPFPTGDLAINNRAKQITFTQLESHPNHIAQPITQDTPERRRRRVRYEELMFKQQASPLNFAASDLVELVPLLEEFQT